MIEISTDAGRLDVALIHGFLANESHWARDIRREIVERALANSLCFGAYEGGRQIGLARVVTDYATFAWLADVFVVAPERGRGVGALLTEAVVSHPELKGLRRAALVTSTAPGLYARYGFAPLASPEIWMERHNPGAYTPPA
ncbi:MAG: GNAT family N-acetyltransferase [Burkholderiales bacterium]